MKYGLISANCHNLGDDIQSLAAERFLPRVDYEIERERFWEFEAPEPVKVICNAWWAYNPSAWPPADCVDPLLISMHIDPAVRNLFATSPQFRQAKTPIGARDTSTLNFLRDENIPAYLSYCLTLTFPAYTGQRNNKIICVDVEPELVPHLASTAEFVRHVRSDLTDKSAAYRRQFAERLLLQYSCASLIITRRLHCALPALAFGTPTVVIAPEDSGIRFSGYENLLNIVPAEELVNVDPAKVPVPDISEIRENLTETCLEFICG